jgi:hypothetical protein
MGPATELDVELRAFFESYADAFHADVGSFCDRFHFPATTVRLDGAVQLFRTKEDALAFFTVAKQRYEAEGCRRWAIHRLAVEPLGSGSAAVTIDWSMLRGDGSPIRGWRQTYNLVGGPRRWKVLLSTLHIGSESSR